MNLSLFPPDEQALRTRIDCLLADWKREVSQSSVVFRGDGKAYSGADYFCADGFFPYYTHQKYKILFLGREAVDMSGCDYIEVLLDAYKKNLVAGKTLDATPFASRMFYLTYGILHDGTVDYSDVPWASELAKTFATEGGASFAFMELSKYSNDADDANAHRDAALMTRFLQDSHLEQRNFFEEELSLLDADLIIGMNIFAAGVGQPLLEKAIGKPRFVSQHGKDATLYTLLINGRNVPFLDLWHFSSRKSTETNFYNPAMYCWRYSKSKGFVKSSEGIERFQTLPTGIR